MIDCDLEKSVLGGILLQGINLPPEIIALEPEYFEIPQHAIIFSAMQELMKKNTNVDEISV